MWSPLHGLRFLYTFLEVVDVMGGPFKARTNQEICKNGESAFRWYHAIFHVQADFRCHGSDDEEPSPAFDYAMLKARFFQPPMPHRISVKEAVEIFNFNSPL